MGVYCRPSNLSEVVDLLSKGNMKILAGGTDYYPSKVGKLIEDDILDVTAVSSLRGIEMTDDGWRIGATTCWSDIVAADLPPLFDGLKSAAREVGGRQIQNVGTIGGNLCNASPAADGVPALLSLGAEVEIAGGEGVLRMPLDAFILGNRRTALKPSQLLVAIHIPKVKGSHSKGSFLKLGSRKYLVISLAMVAGTLVWDENLRITDCKIAVGACSEVAQRLKALEAELIGEALTIALPSKIRDEHFEALSSIDDVRATADYREDAVKTLVQRLVAEWGEFNG